VNIDEMHEQYQDLLMTCVAYNTLLDEYKRRLESAGRPLPTLHQRWEDNIPRVQRLLDAVNKEKTALRHKIMKMEEES